MIGTLGVVAVLVFGEALAAEPTPDRPGLSHTARLGTPHTLELETGVAWSQAGAVTGTTGTAGTFAVPTRLEYDFDGVFEPHVAADLASFGAVPNLSAGAKLKLLRRERMAAALYVASAIPVTAGQPWSGAARLLVTGAFRSGVWVQADGGVNLVGASDPRVAIAGFPALLQIGTPLGERFGVFVEGGATYAGGTVGGLLLDAGGRAHLTEIVIFDAGFGWDLQSGVPFATVGLSVNFGTFGG